MNANRLTPKALASSWMRHRFECLFNLLMLATLTIVSGCAHRAATDGPHFRSGRGDAGQFIVRQAVLRGADPITTNGLPSVTGSWRYAADNAGVIIRLPRNEYPAVESLLKHAFGRPQFGPVDTAEGAIAGAYRLTQKGAALQFGHDTDWTMVIVLRERTDADFAAEFLRGLR